MAVPYARKSGMQLASKMRFVAAQFEALLRGGLWLRSAAHANRMAQLLARRVSAIDGVRIAYPVQANGVFAQLPPAAIEPLQRERNFYTWDEVIGEVRADVLLGYDRRRGRRIRVRCRECLQNGTGAAMSDSTYGPMSSDELRPNVHNAGRHRCR